MKSVQRYLPKIALAAVALVTLGGCVYDPAYYHRNGVVYDDGPVEGRAYYDDGYYDGGYYAPGYYYGPGYYPYYEYGYGWPFGVGLGFSYYGGGHYGGHHYSGHHYSHSGNTHHSGGTHRHH